MKPHRKYLLTAGLFLFFFTSTGIAYASSSTFLTQAQKFISQNCNRKLLADPTALFCYLFYKSQEQDAAIANINATLSPIPSQIASLQASTSALSSTVNNLHQNQSGKAVHVLDATNQDLGLLINGSPGGAEVFNTTLGLLIEIEGDYVGLTNPLAYYTTSNCTGTAYFTSDYAGFLIHQVSGTYTKVDTSIPPVSLTILSDKTLSEPQSNCISQNFGSISNLYTLTQVNNPYQNPVATPLQYKYQ